MNYICGLDEAGRGALAGPLVLVGVVLRKNINLKNIVLRDSKTMSAMQREKAFEFIKNNSVTLDVEIINVNDINQKGIGWANIQGFVNLIDRIKSESYIVDGRFNLKKFGKKKELVKCVVDADAKVLEAIAAGIVAKVTRDKIMRNLHSTLPHYNWLQNKGYGTKKHIVSIKEFGPSIHHRRMFVETALKNFLAPRLA